MYVLVHLSFQLFLNLVGINKTRKLAGTEIRNPFYATIKTINGIE